MKNIAYSTSKLICLILFASFFHYAGKLAAQEGGISVHAPDLSPNYNFSLQGGGRLNHENIIKKFGDINIKQDVKLFHVSPYDARFPVALFNGHTLELSENNIMYFIEPISSVKQIKDLWRIFHPDATIIESRELYLEMAEKSRDFSKSLSAFSELFWVKIKISDDTPQFFGMSARQPDDKDNDYHLDVLMFDPNTNKVSKLSYRITQDGKFGKREIEYISGPMYELGGIFSDDSYRDVDLKQLINKRPDMVGPRLTYDFWKMMHDCITRGATTAGDREKGTGQVARPSVVTEEGGARKESQHLKQGETITYDLMAGQRRENSERTKGSNFSTIAGSILIVLVLVALVIFILKSRRRKAR